MGAGEPPLEWVEGDRVRSDQFALAIGAFLAAAGALVVLINLVLVGVIPPPYPLWIPIPLALLGTELLFLVWFPRRYPIVRRMGISPTTLVLRIRTPLPLPERWSRYPWNSVVIGPGWIELVNGGFSRYRLTTAQMSRLAHFYRLPEPSTLRPGPNA